MRQIVFLFSVAGLMTLVGAPPLQASPGDEAARKLPLETIYFDSDSVDILNDNVIGKNAAWLKGHKSRVVILEGHCDERGDRDYNYSLGDRRARTVLKELIDEGVSPDQLIVMSRGKDRPAVPAGGESGWSKNRRVEFVVR